MRLGHVGVGALIFFAGCVRLGYNAQPTATDRTPDAARDDGGAQSINGAVAEAGSQQDASVVDAYVPVSTADAAHSSAGSGALDAAEPYDASVPNDGAMQGPIDSGPANSDSGPTDSGSSGTGPCAFTVTMNQYVNSPHYHGTLALQNSGAATWTTLTITFDLPSSAYICNDVDVLPGAGWILQSSAGHCVYTSTTPSLAIAPGATLTFEYSSNDPRAPSGVAASNISVAGCP